MAAAWLFTWPVMHCHTQKMHEWFEREALFNQKSDFQQTLPNLIYLWPPKISSLRDELPSLSEKSTIAVLHKKRRLPLDAEIFKHFSG